MPLTKGIAIETIYLRVNGGKTSSQNTIKREDIEPYLISAIAWAWGLAIAERLAQAARNKRLGIADNTSFNDLRLTQYVAPMYDRRKAEHFVEVNKIPNIGGDLYFEVMPTQGTFTIFKINSRADLSGLEDILQNIVYCYYLQIKGQLPRIYFYNLPPFDCELEVTTNFDFSALSDDDFIQAPADKEILIIDKCVEFFLGSKTMAEDNIIDQNDNKNVINDARR